MVKCDNKWKQEPDMDFNALLQGQSPIPYHVLGKPTVLMQ